MDEVAHKLPTQFIGLTFILLPFLAIAGGLGLAPTGFLIGLAGWGVMFRTGQMRSLLTTPWFLILSALLIWACIAQLWSPYAPKNPPSNAVKLIIIVLGYCGIGAAFKPLKPEMKNILSHGFMAGGVFAIGLMLVEVLSGYGLSILVDPVNADEIIHTRQGDAEQNLGRGLLTYTQFLPALFLMFASKFKRGWLFALPLILMIIMTAHLNRLSLPPLVIVLTFITMGLAWKFPSAMVKAVFCLVIIMLIAGPLSGWLSSYMSDAQLSKFPLSIEHRFRMWAYGWERIIESPWLGNGFDVSRSYQDTFLARDGRDIVIVSLHPHNGPIQIWLEIGAVGAALAAATVAMLLKPALQFARSPMRASALTGTIASIALFGATTIGVWQFWWWGSIFIAIAILRLMPDASLPNEALSV